MNTTDVFFKTVSERGGHKTSHKRVGSPDTSMNERLLMHRRGTAVGSPMWPIHVTLTNRFSTLLDVFVVIIFGALQSQFDYAGCLQL